MIVAVVLVTLGVVSFLGWLADREVKRLNQIISWLREIISEREFMVESILNSAYEQGWSTRGAFSSPMHFAHVTTVKEKSN